MIFLVPLNNAFIYLNKSYNIIYDNYDMVFIYISEGKGNNTNKAHGMIKHILSSRDNLKFTNVEINHMKII